MITARIVWNEYNDWGAKCYTEIMEFRDYDDMEKFIDSSYAMGCEDIQSEILEDTEQYDPVVDDPDTTRDCILYALSQAETQEEKDYYWNLLDTADFAEDYD